MAAPALSQGLRRASGAAAAAAARIIVVGRIGEDSALDELQRLPANASVVAHGATLESILESGPVASANCILNCEGSAAVLGPVLRAAPDVKWVHSRFAGVDGMMCDELVNSDIVLTNGKGLFSSSLAEYSMLSAMYFAKDIPRLQRQKQERKWEKFTVSELRGATFGVVGSGDIGMACARLAKAFGMHVMAIRRRPDLTTPGDPVDESLPPSSLPHLMATADYVVNALPLTPNTRHFMGAEAFSHAKGAVLISLGRGPTVDEAALLDALDEGRISGAALDVFEVEPLPASSPIWDHPKVLLSPHCADMTFQFLHRSVARFVSYVPRFIDGEPLDNVVDKSQGY